MVLSAADLGREAERFGVADGQVRRDHAISHVLAVLSAHHADEIVFFGGTALSRTHLTAARLSEDIDLLALGRRSQVAERVAQSLDHDLRRVLGRPRWNPSWDLNSDRAAALLEVGDDVAIRIQLLSATDYSPWPRERRAMEQRYADAPPATLTVPTADAFAAWKMAAWHDRRAPRDLYDLWAMAGLGLLTPAAARLFAKHGPTGGPPRAFMLDRPPAESAWRAQLAGQTRLTVMGAAALVAVRDAWLRSVALLEKASGQPVE